MYFDYYPLVECIVGSLGSFLADTFERRIVIQTTIWEVQGGAKLTSQF